MNLDQIIDLLDNIADDPDTSDYRRSRCIIAARALSNRLDRTDDDDRRTDA